MALMAALMLPAKISPAAPPPGMTAEDVKQIMPASQLHRGMKGYGLTVFHGTKIEKFDVEVLGVMKQMNTGRDWILVRVSCPLINSRNTGIIQGMSGSPVYIDGKLVGAISAGMVFAKEPVGMITPITDMLEAWDQNLPKVASGYSSPQTLPESVTVDGRKATSVEMDPPGTPDAGQNDGTLHMQPLMTPMMVSGLTTKGMARLGDILRPYGIEPMAGMGGAEALGANATLEPGASVGMSLATGDVDVTAVGTVTYRRGDKIVAFGHPFLGIGAIDAPLTTAYVYDVMSSYQASTKMASPIKTVGRIFQDRPWSIAGAVGPLPKTIPVTVQIDDQSDKRTKTYHVNVINHPLLAAKLISLVAGESIAEMHPIPGDVTAEVSYSVMADQVGKIERNNVFYDPVSIETASTADLAGLLQVLSTNRFYSLDVKSVNIKVKIQDKRNTANIDRIFVKQNQFEPGDTIEVGVVLRPYKKDRITKTLKVKIPATTADGKVTLQVRGGASSGGLFRDGPGRGRTSGGTGSRRDGRHDGASDERQAPWRRLMMSISLWTSPWNGRRITSWSWRS